MRVLNFAIFGLSRSGTRGDVLEHVDEGQVRGSEWIMNFISPNVRAIFGQANRSIFSKYVEWGQMRSSGPCVSDAWRLTMRRKDTVCLATAVTIDLDVTVSPCLQYIGAGHACCKSYRSSVNLSRKTLIRYHSSLFGLDCHISHETSVRAKEGVGGVEVRLLW